MLEVFLLDFLIAYTHKPRGITFNIMVIKDLWNLFGIYF